MKPEDSVRVYWAGCLLFCWLACLNLDACSCSMLSVFLADVRCALRLHQDVPAALFASCSLKCTAGCRPSVSCLLPQCCVLPSPPLCPTLAFFVLFLPLATCCSCVQLKRLVRYLRRQQALGRALPEGITPVVLAVPPAQQGMPPRTRM